MNINESFCRVPVNTIREAVNNYHEVSKLMDNVNFIIRGLVVEAHSTKKVLGIFNKRYRFFASHANASKYLPKEYYGQHWECVSGYSVDENKMHQLSDMCNLSDEIYLSKVDSVIVNAYRDYCVETVLFNVLDKLGDSYNKLTCLDERGVAYRVSAAIRTLIKLKEKLK